jgi:hydrogenase/urease accessory protein HupE
VQPTPKFQSLASLFLLAFFATVPLSAHEVRPAHLDISEQNFLDQQAPERRTSKLHTSAQMERQYRVSWKVPAKGGRSLAIDPVFASSCRNTGETVFHNEGAATISTWLITCSEGLAATAIEFPQLPALMIDVLVQIRFLDGREQLDLVRPSAPQLNITSKESSSTLLQSYLLLGTEHILMGWDHLLFVLGLVLLITDWRKLLWTITGFTAAHSLTLGLAALNIVRIPGPPVEAIIALSIVFLAIEVINNRNSQKSTLVVRKPWLVAMFFGLIHGLGFAGALVDYGLPDYARLLSLAAFNIGVELGQLLFVALLLLIARAWQKLALPWSRQLIILSSYFIGSCGTYWLVQRLNAF